MSKRRTLAERFWGKVKKTDGCWLWAGEKERRYGRIRDASVNGRRKNLRTHRVAWVLGCGQIPDGLCVLHRCDNPICVRLDHLFLGTMRDNTDDMMAKGRNRYTSRRGAMHQNAKLSETDVSLIRSEATKGSSRSDLAVRFGVTVSNISCIVRRRSWVKGSGLDAVDGANAVVAGVEP